MDKQSGVLRLWNTSWEQRFWIIGIHKNMDESQDNYGEWKKLGTYTVVQWLTSSSNTGDVVDSISGWGVEIPHAWGPKKNPEKLKQQYGNKFNKEF